jgi:hypothetical protein
LGGLLAVPDNTAAKWLSEETDQSLETLIKLFELLPEDQDLSATWIQATLLRVNEVLYDVQLELPTETLQIGEEFAVLVSLRPVGTREGVFHTLSLSKYQAAGTDLNVFVDPLTVHVSGSKAASLALDLTNLERKTPAPFDQARFIVSARRPGLNKVKIDLYVGGHYVQSLEGEVQVASVVVRAPHLAVRARPVSQPDLLLRVWSKDGASLSFHQRLDTFRGPPLETEGVEYQSGALPADWPARVRGLLADTLEGMNKGVAEDVRPRLASLGRSLYRVLLPPEIRESLRVRSGAGYTLLVVADRDAWLPWELLHDGWGFLGEHFIVGRWPLELDDTRPYEFPIGLVSVAHYELTDTDAWIHLLKAPGETEFQPEVLSGGVMDLDQVEQLRGLHLLRRGRRPGMTDKGDRPIRLDGVAGHGQIQRGVRKNRLTLQRNRPLVSLSYLSQGQAEMTGLEENWGPTYLSAGCSAFVGPLWAVEPAVEAAFVSGFYTALWRGAALGEAFQAARRLAHSAVADSLDWMAYVLFGDPMARPYLPVKSEGYAVVEPVGRQIDDLLSPGGSARYRVKLSRTPPVWHKDRVVEVAKDLVFENLAVHVIASELEVTPSSTIEMIRTTERDYQGWFTLVAPKAIQNETSHVQTYFVDGDRMVHSLMFSIPLQNQGGDSDEQGV